MLTFLFWNLNGKNLAESVARLALAYNVDIVLLAECDTTPEELCRVLHQENELSSFQFAPDAIIKKREVKIFARFDPSCFVPASSDLRYTIRYLRIPGKEELIIAAVHLKSPLHDNDGGGRELGIRQFIKAVKEIESHIKHDRTIVIGDLNVNPFDRIMVIADGLHAVSSKNVARGYTRRIGPEVYPFFYNPMWQLLGDRGSAPGGTFHRDKNDALSYFWHLYDQVLLRPSLLDMWDEDSLTIIVSDGKSSLLKNGIPDTGNFSDHLPLLFRLRI